eukprot:SAG11_NODE_16651_length_541_cov_1.119910_2_plen_29_part_01
MGDGTKIRYISGPEEQTLDRKQKYVVWTE